MSPDGSVTLAGIANLAGGEPSLYQGMKIWITGQTGIGRDTLHYLIGLCALITAGGWAWRHQNASLLIRGVWLTLLLGVVMELADLRDDLASLGHWRWQDSLSDIGRTIAFPVLGVLAVWCWDVLRVRRKS